MAFMWGSSQQGRGLLSQGNPIQRLQCFCVLISEVNLHFSILFVKMKSVSPERMWGEGGRYHWARPRAAYHTAYYCVAGIVFADICLHVQSLAPCVFVLPEIVFFSRMYKEVFHRKCMETQAQLSLQSNPSWPWGVLGWWPICEKAVSQTCL